MSQTRSDYTTQGNKNMKLDNYDYSEEENNEFAPKIKKITVHRGTFPVKGISPISGNEITMGAISETSKGGYLPKLKWKGRYQNIAGAKAVESPEEAEKIVRSAYLKKVEEDLRKKAERLECEDQNM